MQTKRLLSWFQQGSARPSQWTRRQWIQTITAQSGVSVLLIAHPMRRSRKVRLPFSTTVKTELQADHWAPELLEQWAQHAVEAACAVGATYADARLTRIVQHKHEPLDGFLSQEIEVVGIGIRALVNGYWGFTACPVWVSTPQGLDTAIQLAHDAVAQAKVNARGTSRAVDMGRVPPVVGTWTTPIQIDPFSVSLEEKQDFVRYMADLAPHFGLILKGPIELRFIRRESVVATSDGSHFRQTCYESGGKFAVKTLDRGQEGPVKLPLRGLEMAGKGWEVFQEAHLPEQMATMREKLEQLKELKRKARPMTVGRHTLVCDGVTMASLLESTLGLATQLDRALGYEANAGGTTYLDDPLAMLGQFHVASPLVTVTANRSAPAQLATVKWDDEGIEPQPFTLIKDGLLMDFQTTREQAAWLAPYYEREGKTVQSHGCAASENATKITLQHMPNLSLAPSASAIRQEDLIADLKEGLWIEEGSVTQSDCQGRTGLLDGTMRKIVNGQLGPLVVGGTVLFDAQDLWKNITAIGGAPTEGGISSTGEEVMQGFYMLLLKAEDVGSDMMPTIFKGQPGQYTNHSVRSVAATILNQPVIDAARKV